MGYINLVTNILQIIFFCLAEERNSYRFETKVTQNLPKHAWVIFHAKIKTNEFYFAYKENEHYLELEIEFRIRTL